MRFVNHILAGGMFAASCYGPNAAVGIPCNAQLECPSGQVCDLAAPGGPTCVITTSPRDDASPDTDSGVIKIPLDAFEGPLDASVDAAVDAALIYPAPANDLAADAIDVSSGGTYSWDSTGAADDFSPSCAAGSGPDVFFKITLAAPEVIYLDTFGSAANSVIVVRTGDCTPIGSAEACVDDSCGTTQSHGAWSLPAGTHCIIADQVGDTGGSMAKLKVTRGNRAGDPLTGASGSVSGNTCTSDNNSNNSGSCGNEPANDHHFFVAACPGAHSLHIETCTGASWDTVLQIRNNANSSLGCTDDDCSGLQSSLTETVIGPGLFWAIIDGYEDCGAYTMQYSMQ
ncbi:MAG: hypothetical protein AB7P03_22910 [Kofleriaceae bacterium]